MNENEFAAAFHALTDNQPFPWQWELYDKWRPVNFPSSCELPTGLGENVVGARLADRIADHADTTPGRLVYVVNRRIPAAGARFSDRLPCASRRNGRHRHHLAARPPASRAPATVDVAAEGGGISCRCHQTLGGPSGRGELRHDQDVELADLQTQRAQGVVVEVGDDPVRQRHRAVPAHLGDGVDVAAH